MGTHPRTAHLHGRAVSRTCSHKVFATASCHLRSRRSRRTWHQLAMVAPSPFLVLLVSTLITTASMLLGLYLLKHQLDVSRRPVLVSFIGGILIGISLLVLLPEGADELTERYGWPMRHVLLLFIGSAASLFLLEHCVLGHEHAPAPNNPMLASLDAASAPIPAPEPSSIASTAVQCEPCEVTPVVTCEVTLVITFAVTTKQRRQRKLLIGGKPGSLNGIAMSGETGSLSGIAMSGQLPCECCEDSGMLECDRANQGWLTEAFCPRTPHVLAALRLASEATRLLAWMVHSFLDGIALGSCNSTGTLLPLALAMLVCTLQDTSAFCACLHRVSKLRFVIALVSFSLTFLLGVVVSLWSLRSASASPKALELARVIMAAFFVYMAIFEMSPPHTHARLRNFTYLLAFSLGVSIAATTDVLEGVFSGN